MIELVWQTPVQLTGCAVLLFYLLGWSALVGIVTMIALLPVPGYMASLMNDLENEKMKKVGGSLRPALSTADMIFRWMIVSKLLLSVSRLPPTSILVLLSNNTIFSSHERFAHDQTFRLGAEDLGPHRQAT